MQLLSRQTYDLLGCIRSRRGVEGQESQRMSCKDWSTRTRRTSFHFRTRRIYLVTKGQSWSNYPHHKPNNLIRLRGPRCPAMLNRRKIPIEVGVFVGLYVPSSSPNKGYSLLTRISCRPNGIRISQCSILSPRCLMDLPITTTCSLFTLVTS